MTSLNELRAEIKRLRTNATKKASRIRVNHGANVTGSSFDPRRRAGVEKSYNKRQLETYKKNLESFLSRKTQFVGGAGNTPITRQDWLKYKKAETSYNDFVNKNFDSVRNYELPKPPTARRGETIGERMAKMTPDRREMRGSSVNSPYDPVVRDPFRVKGIEALRKLTEAAEKRLRDSQTGKDLKDAREQFSKMKAYIGKDDPIFKDIDSLTDDQFSVLWFFTPFADQVSMEYNILQLLNEGKGKAFAAPTISNARDTYSELIDWAKKI